MTDRFEGRLSEYLDGDLTSDERELVARHLETCEPCASTLAQLEAVAARAADLPPREPARDLWPGIAARITDHAESTTDEAEAPVTPIDGPRSAFGRRISLSMPQLAAAAVTLAAMSAGTAWVVGSRLAGEPGSGAPIAAVEGVPSTGARAMPASGAPSALSAGVETLAGADYYAASIRELESLLFDPARPLPAEAETRIRRALLTIDRAIDDARAALEGMPDDAYLKDHVTSTLRRKSEFLREAVRMAAQS